MTGWRHLGLMEIRKAADLGCYLCGHVCTFIPEPGSYCGWSCSMQEGISQSNYADLSHSHIFAPVTIETAGTFGPHMHLVFHQGTRKAFTWKLER